MNVRIHNGSLKDCHECRKHLCEGCREPYTLSTADEEKKFCSQRCERRVTRK
jgi:hypothetical protein